MLRGTLIGILAALVLPGAASAASHTWVSGVGDDANSCMRTAPCLTFQGAYAKTDPGGEISVLSQGSYGPLTITQPVTINGNGLNALVTPSGSNGFTIAAGAADAVVIEGIKFVGGGAAGDAIRIDSARSVSVRDSELYGFGGSGLDDRSSTPVRIDASGTSIHDNRGDGVLVAPPSGSTGSVSLTDDTINGNACGVVATAFGMPSSPSFGTDCGANTAGAPSGSVAITALDSSIVGNSEAGVFANGTPSTDYLQGDTVTGNATGLQELAGGQIVWIGENWVFANSINGTPTSTVNAGQGAQGPQGPSGRSGQVELVRCKTVIKRVKGKHGRKHKKRVRKCTARLVSGKVKFKTKGRIKHATLSRHGTVYAVGTMVSGPGGASEAILNPQRNVPAGRYELTLSENGRRAGRLGVTVS